MGVTGPGDVIDDRGDDSFDNDFMGELEGIISNHREPLSKNEIWGNELEGQKEYGHWDRCAWYQPIHYYGRDWGIFIRQDCILKKALRIARYLSYRIPRGVDLRRLASWLQRAATLKYFLHEHFHHKVECLGLRFHVMTDIPYYADYKQKIYRKYFLTAKCLEESLANADAYRRLGDNPYKLYFPKPWLGYLRDYLKKIDFPTCPPGYRQALNFLKKKEFEDGEDLLHGQMKEASLSPVQPVSEWKVAPRLTQSFFSVKSNIWEIVPHGKRPIRPVAYPAGKSTP
jgi:hypothetical protein